MLAESPTFIGRAKNRPKRHALLLPYQTNWVKDNSRLKLMEKGRQIGLSFACAYRQVSIKAVKTARLDSWISSRDDIQARLFLMDCKAFAVLLNLAANDLGERIIDDDGHSAYVLAMANGLRINSMSSNPDAQAGTYNTGQSITYRKDLSALIGGKGTISFPPPAPGPVFVSNNGLSVDYQVSAVEWEALTLRTFPAGRTFKT